jgi:predicted Fe-Mo cluster-binding NifX family protein
MQRPVPGRRSGAASTSRNSHGDLAAIVADCTWSRRRFEPIARHHNGFAFLETGLLGTSVMRIAIPHWQSRVSPVFDAAASVLLFDIEDGAERQREERQLTRTDPLARAGEFLKLGADVLICGAISAPLEAALVSADVQVIGFVCGPVEEVLGAYLSGELANPAFGMPGVRGWRRRFGHRRDKMPKGFGMGSGRGRGGGGGRTGSRGGRMGGPLAAGPGGSCVCPNCGEKTPHTAGQPCNRLKCPNCGTPMTRA